MGRPSSSFHHLPHLFNLSFTTHGVIDRRISHPLVISSSNCKYATKKVHLWNTLFFINRIKLFFMPENKWKSWNLKLKEVIEWLGDWVIWQIEIVDEGSIGGWKRWRWYLCGVSYCWLPVESREASKSINIRRGKLQAVEFNGGWVKKKVSAEEAAGVCSAPRRWVVAIQTSRRNLTQLLRRLILHFVGISQFHSTFFYNFCL